LVHKGPEDVVTHVEPVAHLVEREVLGLQPAGDTLTDQNVIGPNIHYGGGYTPPTLQKNVCKGRKDRNDVI
jgi:hypothetical protein